MYCLKLYMLPAGVLVKYQYEYSTRTVLVLVATAYLIKYEYSRPTRQVLAVRPYFL